MPSKKMVPNEKSVACSVGSSFFLRDSALRLGFLLEGDLLVTRRSTSQFMGERVSPAFM